MTVEVGKLMRKWMVTLMIMAAAGMAQGSGIVNNSGSSTEDSLTFIFCNLDSSGQNIGGLDTTRVVVCNAAGAVVFSEKIAEVAGRVSRIVQNDDTTYVYRAAVADIDGAGAAGVYTLSIVAKSNATGGWLKAPHTFSFQVAGWELDAMGDSAMAAASRSAAALDSLGKTLDSVYKVMDSLYAALDTLQNHDDWAMVAVDTNSNGDTLATSGEDRIMRLRGLHIRGTGAGDTGLVVQGGSSAPGAYLAAGGGDNDGLKAVGSGTGAGIYGTSSGGNGAGIKGQGNGAGSGLLGIGGGTGNGIRGIGGSTSGNGCYLSASDGRGMYAVGGGGKAGVEAQGNAGGSGFLGVGGPTGNGVRGIGGSTSGHALRLDQTSGYAVDANGTMNIAGQMRLVGSHATEGALEIQNGGNGPAVRLYSNNASPTLSMTNDGAGLVWQASGGGDNIVLGAINGSLRQVDSVDYVDSLDQTMTAEVDSAQVARAVWNTPQTNHTLGGTFGKYLDTEVSGIGPGSGAYSVSLVAYDSIADQPIGDVALAVRNAGQTALVATGYTDVNGRAVVNLDADSFCVVATASGYIFGAFDTLIVSGTMADTSWGATFDPGAPGSPSLCRVYGFLYDLSAVPTGAATVEASLPDGVRQSGSRLVSPFSVSSATDSTGYFYLDLIPSDSLVPENTRYELTISTSDGVVLRKRLEVPAVSTWRLTW
jgi:hypothetical protein